MDNPLRKVLISADERACGCQARRDPREERSVRTGYMSTAARGATPHGARRRRSLPALGLDVVHMGVLPGLDGSDDLADVDAILDDGVADIHILESDLVSQ